MTSPADRSTRGHGSNRPGPLEDYAIIGNCETVALVGRSGSIDWWCVPRFDSPAVFAALLGTVRNGRWLLAPVGEVKSVTRRYRDTTLILETDVEVDEGLVRLVDFMAHRRYGPRIVRIVQGLAGCVAMQLELVIRPDYGRTVPWVERTDGSLRAVAGPNALHVSLPVDTHGHGFRTLATFDVPAGETLNFSMQWYPSHRAPVPDGTSDPDVDLNETVEQWQRWNTSLRASDDVNVRRSAITLKALTHEGTGAIVAAPTTSLPEQAGGVRNWDYRYCWLRDAGFACRALLQVGQVDEAKAWRRWLVRAVAGKPSQCQVAYGVAGERRLDELELPWLRGYEGARPVRIGNAAVSQFQLDVYGHVLDALHVAREAGLDPSEDSWEVQRSLVDHVARVWHRPDHGIWEMRGPRRHFVHSKVMAWVALDRGIKAIERHQLPGPLRHWQEARAGIRVDICRRGFNATRRTFTQAYNRDGLDAAVLMMPLVGFIPADDPRMMSTIDVIEQRLVKEGFVRRYSAGQDVDGLPAGESTFLPCTFWLAAALAAAGRTKRARAYYERARGVANDVGLLSEEYDHCTGRMMGNFPQALSHVALMRAAHVLKVGQVSETI